MSGTASRKHDVLELVRPPATGEVPHPRQNGTSQSHTFATRLDDGSLVLGALELKGKTLILSVNSQGRANRGRAFLSELLSGLVREPLVDMQTLNQVMASRPDFPPRPEPNLTEDERRTIIHQSLDRHYREMPTKVASSDKKQIAARRGQNRQGSCQVIDWLKMLENSAAKSAGRNDDMATYDFAWLWAELGLKDLRR